MKTKLIRLTCFLAALLALATEASAQTTAFTYQGRLTENGVATQGVYDLRFTIYDAVTNGLAVAAVLDRNDTATTNGLFTVTLDYGASAFDGGVRWLEIAVRPGASAGAYTNLVPRQPVTSTPYAIRAVNAASATTASSVAPGAVTSSGLAPGSVGATAIADGSIISADLNASLLNTTFWKLDGNNLGPGQFIGSTNNQAVEFKVSGERALRLEPRGLGISPTVLGGYYENNAGTFRGAAIAGGGTSGAINQADGNYGFIGAGIGGRVANSAVVGGGSYNSALGTSSLVGSGIANTNRGDFAAIVAGTSNTITPLADNAFIGGGRSNTANNTHATVGGGENNRASSWATVGGGKGNQSDAAYATVAGGRGNISSGTYATVAGGSFNLAGGESSFAAGTQAKANHQGSFVWADSQNANFASTTSNQFSIRAAGGVQLSPFTSLNFGQTTRQMLNLWSTNYGVGVQSLTTYFRTDSADGGGGFAWYQGGMHSDANQDPGAGGQKLMSLTATGLEVSGTGPGVQGTTSNGGAPGVIGQNNGGGIGIAGKTTGGGIAVYGDNLDPAGYAGLFSGRVHVDGNVGIGTTQPSARLSLVGPGASELAGSARSATLLTSAGSLGTAAGDELALATIGFRSGNNSSLGIRALRVADGSSWSSTAIGLGMDVDNDVRPGANLWLHANGNVGLGTPSPQAKLHVAVPGSASPISAIQLEVGTFGTVANSLASTFLTVRDAGSGQMAFMIRGDGNVGIGTANPQAQLDVAGLTRTSVLTITGGADIAEPFKMSGKDLPKGAVVVIDEANPGQLRLSESAYDTRVAGIISGANGVNPGISLSQEGVMEGGQNVALSGRVYVQADTSNGPIKPGDLLTTSATPGHAMKVAEHGKAQGAILGKAMTALAEGKGMVLVLVTLQ